MPKGCEFVCVNPSCDHYNSGFSMHDFWPLSDIDDVISSQTDTEIIQGLESLKKEGIKLVCTPIPIKNNMKIHGVRVQLYCEDPSSKESPIRIINQDIICDVDKDRSIPKDSVLQKVIRVCDMCNVALKTFTEIYSKGINCPHCSEKMDKKTWFTSGG